MTYRSIVALTAALIAACLPAAAQDGKQPPSGTPRISLRNDRGNVTAVAEPAEAKGSVLLESGGRIIGYRDLHDGKAVWSSDDLPPGDFTLRAVFAGGRSQSIQYHRTTTPISGFSSPATFPRTSSAVRALISSTGLSVLGRSAAYALHGNSATLIPTGRLDLGGRPDPAALPGTAVVADFDGDGIPDLAEVRRDDVGIVFMRSDANAAAAPITISNGQNSAHVAAGDFNGDGFADLVIVDGHRRLLGHLGHTRCGSGRVLSASRCVETGTASARISG